MDKRYLVVTDMDGTLLNHHDYQVEAALPMLRKLEHADIPVIFNTSKTFAELKELVRQLSNRHPFIVENGSAIYIPENYFASSFHHPQPDKAESLPGYRVLVTGVAIQAIQSFLTENKPDAINFTQCSVEEAMNLTGLSYSEAESAQNRQYSVPLFFSDSRKEEEFRQQALSAGFGVLKGGRFLHVLGQCDKGQALIVLKQLYEDYYASDFLVIALGDSPNDRAMLDKADIPIIVNSPSSSRMSVENPLLIRTRHSAPDGWAEGVQRALNNLPNNNITESSHGG